MMYLVKQRDNFTFTFTSTEFAVHLTLVTTL
jgi:hypothetical protein